MCICNSWSVFALIDKCATCNAESDHLHSAFRVLESGGLPQWSPHSCTILFHGSRGSYLIASMSRIWHLSQNLDQNEDLFPGVHERWPVVDSKEDVGRFQIWVVSKFVQPHQLWELCLLLTSTSMRLQFRFFLFLLQTHNHVFACLQFNNNKAVNRVLLPLSDKSRET